jgi:haloalkane dehalogenase
MKKYQYRLLPVLFCGCLFMASCKEDAPVSNGSNTGVTTDPELGEILQTPASRFDNLPGYNFTARYVDVGTTVPLKMHYIDEGPANGKLILLLHGNPAWVYNFRQLVPLLTAAGYRVVAPDLIGFGKSDKPSLRSAHTYDRHVTWITTFIQKLNLNDIHLHCQDWGGLLGLRVVIQNQQRFAKVAASNTSLPEGDNVTQAFLQWRTSSQSVATYGSVIERGTYKDLTNAEEAAYDAPFPEEKYKAGPREMPLKVPISPTDAEGIENQQLWAQWRQWQKPFLTIFSDTDPISDGEQQRFISRIPGATGQQHRIVPNTNHFIREDEPQLMVQYLIDFFN